MPVWRKIIWFWWFTHFRRKILSSRIMHFFRKLFQTEKQDPQTFSFLENMPVWHQSLMINTNATQDHEIPLPKITKISIFTKITLPMLRCIPWIGKYFWDFLLFHSVKFLGLIVLNLHIVNGLNAGACKISDIYNSKGRQVKSLDAFLDALASLDFTLVSESVSESFIVSDLK